MNRVCSFGLAAVAAGLAMSSSALAAIPASDNADDAAYTVPAAWNAGSNGGTGWSPWVFNSFGSPAGGFHAGAGNPDLQDVKSPNHSWGTYANQDGTQAFAAYRRTQGDLYNTANLVNGQTVAIGMEHGGITPGGFAGVGFGVPTFGIASPYASGLTGAANFQVLVGFFGGASFYELRDSAGAVTTTIPWSDRGLLIEFTLLNANTGDYTMKLTSISNPLVTQTIGGRQVSGGIDSIGLYNYDTNDANVYFNSFTVVPAPGALALMGVGGLVAIRRRRGN